MKHVKWYVLSTILILGSIRFFEYIDSFFVFLIQVVKSLFLSILHMISVVTGVESTIVLTIILLLLIGVWSLIFATHKTKHVLQKVKKKNQIVEKR